MPLLECSSSPVVVVADLISENESLHNYYDFDLVGENSKNIAGVFASDEINFGNRILTDYIESRTNRAISIDSVSSQFNDLPRATAFSDVFDFNLNDIDGIKFYVLLFDTRFSGEKEIIQVNLLHDGSTGYMMKFGRVETAIDLGDFDFAVSGVNGNLRFVPAKSKFNNYALRLFAIETFKNTQTGISTLSVGTGYDIISTSSGIGSTDPSPVQVVGFGSTAITTSKLFIQTQELGGDQRTQLNELVVLNDSEEVYLLDYAQMTNDNLSIYRFSKCGTWNIWCRCKIWNHKCLLHTCNWCWCHNESASSSNWWNCNRNWKYTCINHRSFNHNNKHCSNRHSTTNKN